MEKLLICDICGTSYAYTEERCPTCGYARAFDLESLYSERPSITPTKVRGGRYSKKNVQRRLQMLAAQENVFEEKMEIPAEDEQLNVEAVNEEISAPVEEISVIPEETVVEEIIEIPAEEIFIEEAPAEEERKKVEEAFPADLFAEAIDFVFPEEELQENAQEQEEELVLEIPEEIVFVEELPQEPEQKPEGSNIWLNLVLGFASVVFILSAMYLVVKYAVPAVKEMLPPTEPTVVATEAPTTEPTEADTEAPTEAEEVLILNYTQLTFTKAEDSSKIFAVGIADREIIWTSDDPAVASVTEAGRVIAVGAGTTTIHAVYGELEAVVTVTCDFE